MRMNASPRPKAAREGLYTATKGKLYFYVYLDKTRVKLKKKHHHQTKAHVSLLASATFFTSLQERWDAC